MGASQPVTSRICRATPTRRVTTLAPLFLVVLAFTLTSCGDDSKPEESKAELKSQLAKLPKHIQDDFRAGDTNNDLRLQDTELEAMVEEDFTSSDLDHDGEITGADVRKEFDENSGAGEKLGEKTELDVDASLAFIDLNKDGRVPLKEYAEHVDRHFHQLMDTNKDGHIDPSESTVFYQRMYGGEEAE
jgi:Ca2+-binding EF-hand superfamily protein